MRLISVFLPLLLAACKSESHAVQGKARLSLELQQTLKPTATLYLIARRPGVLTGPPLAVKRFGPPLLFPLDFLLSERDLMMPGQSFAGNLTLMARISQSGDAIPVATGDIEGFARASYVPVGAEDVEIELDQVRK